MVTTRQTSDTKVIAMEDQAGGAVAPPPRTLLEEVNAHLICVLCRGYYIDATTIVECLHSFCRSCIVKHLQVKSYCPVCEMMINSAKPNIKPDKALQDIVYKLVPGLFQREMQRRQSFYSSRPRQAANATPEQRGEDTERIIFSPEDVISFSLEYMDCTETESASSRSSESGNESTPYNEAGAPTRRYLQCPAVVNISHLKKFLSMKYDIDATHFFVDILYKRVPLPDYYTLMDIAYIYNWKRNEPMRFFYQITDFAAIRDRFGFFGIDRPGLPGHRKLNPSSSGGTAPSSPAHEPPVDLPTDPGSDVSSGSYSPVPQHDSKQSQLSVDSDKVLRLANDPSPVNEALNIDFSQSSSSMDVEKSQFLNSFELTAKNCINSGKNASSPLKEEVLPPEQKLHVSESKKLSPVSDHFKLETHSSPSKRKFSGLDEESGNKKPKLTPEKPKDSPLLNFLIKPAETLLTKVSNSLASNCAPSKIPPGSSQLLPGKVNQMINNKPVQPSVALTATPQYSPRVLSKSNSSPGTRLTSSIDSTNPVRKCSPPSNKLLPIKRKLSSDTPQTRQFQKPTPQQNPENSKSNTISSVKFTDSKPRPPGIINENKVPLKTNTAVPKVTVPPKVSESDAPQKPAEPNKELQRPANILKPPPRIQLPKPKTQNETLKTLLDSCKIPSSLSITLTDQKSDSRLPEASTEGLMDDNKRAQGGSGQAMTGQILPSSFQSDPLNSSKVHNSIEILKLPVSNCSDKATDTESITKNTVSTKISDSSISTKGPIPNLKPIADTKQTKGGSFNKPQTFQQTFLQSLQQQSDKPKYIKTRIDFPKLGSGTSKIPEEGLETTITSPVPSLNRAKPVPTAQPIRKQHQVPPKLNRPDSALDLSTPHTVQSQLGPQQAKALETMQSIANLAKKQSYSQRMTSPSQVFSQESFKMNTTNASPLRIPVPPPHSKLMKTSTSSQSTSTHSPKHFPEYYQPLKATNSMRNSNSGSPVQNTKSTQSNSSPYSQNTQRAQTRSPSSSPKLVIACPSPKSQSPEQKRLLSPRVMDGGSQSNLISSSQISSTNVTNESSGSKDPLKVLKTLKPQTSTKPPGARGTASHKPGPATSAAHKPGPVSSAASAMAMNPLFTQQAYLRQQLDLQTRMGFLPPGAANQWFNNPVARAHFDNIVKNMAHNSQMPFSNNHNMKDK